MVYDRDMTRTVEGRINYTGDMTERERYRTRGSFYFITDDYLKCTDEYGMLIAKYSADVAAINNAPDSNREFISISYQFTRPLGR